MPLTTDEIDRIATLARLRLTPEERRALPEQLRRIVGFVDRLEGFETDPGDGQRGPPSGGLEAEDDPAPCLPRGLVLANAPAGGRGTGSGVPSAQGPETQEPETVDAEPTEGFFVVPEVK